MTTSTAGRPLKVLYIEDNLGDRTLVARALKADGLKCELNCVKTRQEFDTALESVAFDVIISDFTLPAFDGMSALKVARGFQPEVPFLFFSGTIGEERAVDSLKSGATDYVLKDHVGRLGSAVRRALAEKEERDRRKILEEQLRQAQKMEAIGQLAGGVAHDFNNMLFVIRANTELVQMKAGQLSPELTDCLKQISMASERAANLTRQLLAFSRKQVLQAQPVAINELVANLVKMLNRIIGENVHLECHYASHLPAVYADPGMIEQVIMNLVVNARDAMPQGGRLRLATDIFSFNRARAQPHPEARAGQFVCLEINDSGTGIAPDHLAHIFEPFFTTKEHGKGTGLGLATVYGIVKQHNGWIEVATRVGEGTTFKVFLPVMSATQTNETEVSPEKAPRGGTETILLVEDEPSVRIITRRVLESFGYKVHEAGTAREAQAIWHARRDQIDLLLTDMVLAEATGGQQLAKEFRAQKSALKVILMSGYSPDIAGKDTDFFRKSSTCFLQKPCASGTLLNLVRHCLDGARVSG